jgi:hypothetical protein
MIVIEIMGGLGNQMFQYAAGRSLSLRLGVPLQLDLTWFLEPHSACSSRPFLLRCFPCGIVGASPETVRRTVQSGLIRRLTGLISGKLSGMIREPGYQYWESFEKITAPAYLSGYWQNERYFKAATSVIREDFIFPEFPTVDAYCLADAMRSTPNSVAVHVRRGDYIANPVMGAFHGICPKQYYADALQYLRAAVGHELAAFVFSDEPDWVREYFDSPGLPVTVVDFPEHILSPWHDMHLMTLCRHHIIANSSFSWWGAWLGETDGGVVCAPSRWFLAENMEDASPIPDRWVRL